MTKEPLPPCESMPVKKEKIFPYEQYYIGERDEVKRRSGNGQNCWSSPDSLESYTGRFLRDTMHGIGEYRWRYRGPDGVFVTYEGYFYGNNLHGYGVMSYPDGKVFNGHYFNNVRWGPGIESQISLRQNVGLWEGTQLIRLTWKPSTPSVAIDFMSNNIGRMCIEPHRIVMTSRVIEVGEVNSALELLKQYGADSLSAIMKCTKLYTKHSTDLHSELCDVPVFDRDYYNGKILALTEVQKKELESLYNDDTLTDKSFYYAWNNNPNIIHMMKSCYKHEWQRDRSLTDLANILSGARSHFKRAGKHELDCRMLLMASYLGHISNVAQLVNECQVNANVTDAQGNSAVMYAACGDQVDIIHFLIEAGANVNKLNDACCTPLTVALLRYACLVQDIKPHDMVQAILPNSSTATQKTIFEWNITRDVSSTIPVNPARTASKVFKSNPKLSMKNVSKQFKKQDLVGVKNEPSHSLEYTTDEDRIYYNINSEYNTTVNNLFLISTPNVPIPYLFEANNMIKDIDSNDTVEQKKASDKNLKRVTSKTLRNAIKPSQDALSQESEEHSSIDSVQKLKNEMLLRINLTILQILKDGANPRLVRYPQPALLIATIAGSSDLVRYLVQHGVDVNEIYPQIYNYTALDVAVSRAFTYENLELIKTLLLCGANAKHRLQYDNRDRQDPMTQIPGPTLLHVVLARKLHNEPDEEVRRELLILLLKYRCDPLLQFKGQSAIDVALSMNINIFDAFIKNPGFDLNSVINENKQTILCKIFTMPFCKTLVLEDRLHMITNLLLYGADPMLELSNGDEKYRNLFVYAKKVYVEIESSHVKTSSPAKGGDLKGRKPAPAKKEEKLATKSAGKLAIDDLSDYKQALDLATECARMLHIRWIQAKLAKELIDIVHKYNHRQWNVILRQDKNKIATGLWLTATRCLEIWHILKTTRRKIYHDERTLKSTLCIVQYYFRNPKESAHNSYISAQEKACVENDIRLLLRERKMVSTPEMTWRRTYVMPEIAVKANKKFNICFECMLPFEEEKIECCICRLVYFCSCTCMKLNTDRSNCHPCRELIKVKYFQSPDNSLNSPVA